MSIELALRVAREGKKADGDTYGQKSIANRVGIAKRFNARFGSFEAESLTEAAIDSWIESVQRGNPGINAKEYRRFARQVRLAAEGGAS